MESQISKEAEALELPALTDMQKLAALKGQIDNFDQEIKNLEMISGIMQLRNKRMEAQDEYSVLIAKIGSSVTFSEDRFLAALKRKGDSYREGNLKLIRNRTDTRAVISEKFGAKFPELALQICKIPVGKAEALVGKVNLADYCTVSTTYSYELVDMNQQKKLSGGMM